jgi:hypothetical protein
MIGFILTRHVHSIKSNEYWIECVRQIRKFYPENKIVIIDDNSDPAYLNNSLNLDITNIITINSEFKGRGEFLPYYYFYKDRYFEKAVILHDSVFIQEYIDFESVEDVKFLWDFHAKVCEEPVRTRDMLLFLSNTPYLFKTFDDKESWKGCFGAMSVISYYFLSLISEKYHLFTLLDQIKCRKDRQIFERTFAVICHTEKKNLINDPSFFGCILKVNPWRYSYDHYARDKTSNNINNSKIIKTCSGR